ncbi:MAG: ferredoxin:thioredoxin reductase [Methanosarcinaceae archaeon]|nr:ferredoxin:thioredoxin reductase [Methanosarcinaceae archaeon]
MNEHEELKQQIFERTSKYAEKAGYKLNPDKEILDIVVEGLATNKEKYGKQYCPCRIVTGDEEQDRKIICPCAYHKDEIEKNGMCHCVLFFREDWSNHSDIESE